MVVMYQQIYKWSILGGGEPNCTTSSFTQGCKCSLVQLSERRLLGGGVGIPGRPVCASQADKGVCGKVMISAWGRGVGWGVGVEALCSLPAGGLRTQS